MIKKYRAEIILFYIASICSLIVASFYDLQIDKVLNNPENPLALWFYRTGEIPSNLVFMLGGLAIYYFASNKLLKYAGLLAEIGGGIFLGIYLSGYMFVEDGTETITGAIYGLGTALVFLLIGKYIVVPEKAKKPLVVLAIIGMIVMLAKTGATEISKIFWGRERFRMLLEENNFDNFTPWYKPQGTTSNNEFKSFPSGHTSGAGISYLAMFLPLVSDKLKNKTKLYFIAPFVYTSVVAFTRLVMGAHFLSDVTVGGMIAFTCVVIAMAIVDKKSDKLGLNV